MLRLFLPPQLHTVFKAINRMEISLRDLVATQPKEEFRAIYIEGGGLRATRRNVLAPGAVGIYTAGANYNPAQVLRDPSTAAKTAQIDKLLASIDNKDRAEISIDKIVELIELTAPDPNASEAVWDSMANR